MKAFKFISSLFLVFVGICLTAMAVEASQGHLATVIIVSQLTFNGKEIRSLAEAVMEAVFEKPELNAVHKMVPGIVAKQQIALLGRLGTTGIKDPGCDPESSSNNIPLSEKFWNPEGVFNRDEQCYTDLEQSFFVWGLMNGVKKPDLTNTDFAKFLIERTDDAVLESIWRISWFGDLDAAATTASPPGNLGDAANVKFFDLIDGFWKQIFTITTANPKRRTVIPENAEALEVDQLDLAANRAFVMLQDMFANADKRLKGRKDKVVYWTDSLNDNLTEFLESQNVSASFLRIEKGTGGQLSFRGTPLVVIDSWDRNIAEFFNDGTVLHLPHRALLTIKDNTQIGIEDEAAMNTLDPFYDKTTKKYIVDSLFKLDSKIVEDHWIQAAF